MMTRDERLKRRREKYYPRERQKATEYRQLNREKINEVARNKWRMNPEKMRAYCRAWTRKNHEKCRAKQQKWYYRNREKRLAALREWQHANKDECNRKSRAWYASNREKRREYERGRAAQQQEKGIRRYAQKLNTAIDGDREATLKIYKRCQQLKRWFNVAVDHIIPLSRGGAHTSSNLQIIYASENSAKCNRSGYVPRVIFS